MENPAKQIPKAIIAGGIAIAVVYLISAFGIGVAIPVADLTVDSGISDALAVMYLFGLVSTGIGEAIVTYALGLPLVRALGRTSLRSQLGDSPGFE